MFSVRLILTAFVSLLTLTLFDDNSWWLVLIFSVPIAFLNTRLNFVLQRANCNPVLAGLGKGVFGAALAFLAGTSPLFRSTTGTLICFALLLTWSEYKLSKLTLKKWGMK